MPYIFIIFISLLFISCASPDASLPPKLQQYESVQQQCEQYFDGDLQGTDEIEKSCRTFMKYLKKADTTAQKLTDGKFKKGAKKEMTVRYSRERNRLKLEYNNLITSIKHATMYAIKYDQLHLFEGTINFPDNPLSLPMYKYMKSKEPYFDNNKKYEDYKKTTAPILLKKGQKYLSNGKKRKALSVLKISADMGNATAAKIVADLYFNSNNIVNKEYAFPLYTQACKGEVFGACNALGSMYYLGQGTHVNKLKAKEIYTIACEKNDYKACENLGQMYYNHDGVSEDKNLSVQLYKKVCQNTSTTICTEFADKISTPQILQRDYKTAEYLYDISCNMGDKSSCMKAGYLYLTDKSITDNRERSFQYFKSTCINNCKQKYFLLGTDLYAGKRHTSDKAMALDLFKEACSLKNSHACVTAAKMYKDGDGIDKDVNQSLTFYQAACTLKDNTACVTGGDILSSGISIPIDYKRSLQLYVQACKNNDANSCLKVSKIYKNGVGTKIDINRSQAYYTKSCQFGNASACLSIGQSYNNKNDSNNALNYFDLACQQGSQKGCREHQKITSTFAKKLQIQRNEEMNIALQKSSDLRRFESIDCSLLNFNVINEDNEQEHMYYISGTFELSGNSVSNAVLYAYNTEYSRSGYATLLVQKSVNTIKVKNKKFSFYVPVYYECPRYEEWQRLKDKTFAERERIRRAKQGVLPSDTRKWNNVNVTSLYTIQQFQSIGVTPYEYSQWHERGITTPSQIERMKREGKDPNTYQTENVETYVRTNNNYDGLSLSEYNHWKQVGLRSRSSIMRLKALDLDWDDYKRWTDQGVRRIGRIEKYENSGLYPSLYATLRKKGKLRQYLRTGRY